MVYKENISFQLGLSKEDDFISRYLIKRVEMFLGFLPFFPLPGKLSEIRELFSKHVSISSYQIAIFISHNAQFLPRAHYFPVQIYFKQYNQCCVLSKWGWTQAAEKSC